MFQPHDPPWCRPAGHIAQSIVGVVEIVIQRGSCDGIADGGHLGGSLGVGDIPVQVLPGQRTHGNRAEPPQTVIAQIQGLAQGGGHGSKAAILIAICNPQYTVKLPDFQCILQKRTPESENSGVRVNKHRWILSSQ